MKRHDYDGMRTGDSNGLLWRIYEPRWWQLGRWLRLLWLVYVKKIDMIRFGFTTADGKTTRLRALHEGRSKRDTRGYLRRS